MTAPLIGITTDLRAAAWHDRVREAALSPAAYSRAVERAGAVPVLLPPVPSGGAARLAAGLDGLVFAGGPDLDPRRYGAPLDDQVAGWPDQARDAVELELMQAAIEAGTPLLAICRGLQVLNVARGGTLLNDQPDAAGHDRYRPGSEPPGREVRVRADSSLGALLGTSVTVPACRHQGLARLGSGVIAIAWAAEQVVAAELTGHRFGVGVHWHPEQGDDLRIFEALRAAAAASPHLAGTAAAR